MMVETFGFDFQPLVGDLFYECDCFEAGFGLGAESSTGD